MVRCHGLLWEKYSRPILSLWLRLWRPVSVGSWASYWRRRLVRCAMQSAYILYFGYLPCAVYLHCCLRRLCYQKPKARHFKKSRTYCTAETNPRTTKKPNTPNTKWPEHNTWYNFVQKWLIIFHLIKTSLNNCLHDIYNY